MDVLIQWVLLAAGGLMVLAAGFAAMRSRRMVEWKTVLAGLDGEPQIQHIGTGGEGCFAVFAYSYRVAGKVYSGEWRSPLFPNERQAREWVARSLPRTAGLTVKYRPDRPQVSELETQIPETQGHADL